MNIYRDFVIVHNIQLDPRDVKLFVDWLLSCEPESQSYKIGEAMQEAVNNYCAEMVLNNTGVQTMQHNTFIYDGEEVENSD